MDDAGDYERMWRRLSLDTSGWMRGRGLLDAMGALRRNAENADRDPGIGNLTNLRLACQRLEREAEQYRQQVDALRREAAALTAAVHAAMSVYQAPPEVDNGIPLEDEMLERLSDLYGIRRPKPRR